MHACLHRHDNPSWIITKSTFARVFVIRDRSRLDFTERRNRYIDLFLRLLFYWYKNNKEGDDENEFFHHMS